jgi:uncharacterized membrane protein
LTSFGIFWTGEGIGADWPGADLSLIGIFVTVTATAWVLTQRYATAPATQAGTAK